MDQIYYTQCPIGYGLGASNGFQVKRLSPGYPMSGDFRHLGLRAFLPGSRTLAPGTLRYRKGDDGTAEVAWLTPRTHEYETERGLWGRPGGHFAHGLRLDGDALASLRHWPAGLFGGPFWKRSDPGPSLGRPPEPQEIGADGLRAGASFATAAALADGRDPHVLALLLTALAGAVRDGRTLFLVDRPERLADHAGLLTLALPEPWRDRVTFSTYHDRPEELAGFRLQGTSPDPRLNRGALLAIGVVADLASGTFEPRLSPSRWAKTLAGWLTEPTDAHRDAWDATNRHAAQARDTEPTSGYWPDDPLDRLYGLPATVAVPADAPDGPDGWSALATVAAWGAGAGFGRELAGARGPAWWREHAGAEGASAMIEHMKIPTTWEGNAAAPAWGEALGRWLDAGPPEGRVGLFAAAIHAASASARPALVRSALGSASTETARAGLAWLRSQPGVDAAVLLPLEVRRAANLRDGAQTRRALAEVIARASRSTPCLVDVLDALGDEARRQPCLKADGARAIADVLGAAEPKASKAVVRWALGRGGDAADWLAPFLRRVSAGPDALDRWTDVVGLVEPPQRPAFARAGLAVAAEPGGPDEVFRWLVDALLMTLPEPERPHDPAWPGEYLDRMPSGLDLLQRLYGREFRERGVRAWLEAANDRGELSAAHHERIEGCLRYARALKSGDARELLRTGLPAVPPSERGALLGQILSRVGNASSEPLFLALDACRASWPGGFRPGAEGLESLGVALADRLLSERTYPDLWFDRLVAALDRLGLRAAGGGFEPDGLAAEVVAVTARAPGQGASPWRIRQFVLGHPDAWKALAADVRRSVRGQAPVAVVAALDDWDRSLSKGVHTGRFFEVWLNACDGPALAATVAARGRDLRTLPDLSWWDWRSVDGAADDLRDAFARNAPIAPIDEEALGAVQGWVRKGSIRTARADAGRPAEPGDDLIPLDDEPAAEPVPVARGPAASSVLSEAGRARWRCLEAVSALNRRGLDTEGRWQVVEGWYRDLPLAEIPAEDRWLFLAWVVSGLGSAEEARVAALAAWLVRSGLDDPERVAAWADELAPFVELTDPAKHARAGLVSSLRSAWRGASRS